MRLRFYIFSQLLLVAVICGMGWFVFIDWSKVTWFELILAIVTGVGLINLIALLKPFPEIRV
jgi:hypothetical protein